jgi:hypothetical protein
MSNNNINACATTDEEKRKYEINKMFDVSEGVLMEYFCYFFKKKPEELFEGYADKNVFKDELILCPLKDYNDGVNLHFKLEIVEHDHKNCIPVELRSHSVVIDVIKFLEHAVQEVFSAILHTSSKDATPLIHKESVHLELDHDNLSFKPVYIYPQKRDIYTLTKYKEGLNSVCLEYASKNGWVDPDEEEKLAWSRKIKRIDEILDQIHYDQELAAEEEEKNNKRLADFKRIGIIFTESSDTR